MNPNKSKTYISELVDEYIKNTIFTQEELENA